MFRQINWPIALVNQTYDKYQPLISKVYHYANYFAIIWDITDIITFKRCMYLQDLQYLLQCHICFRRCFKANRNQQYFVTDQIASLNMTEMIGEDITKYLMLGSLFIAKHPSWRYHWYISYPVEGVGVVAVNIYYQIFTPGYAENCRSEDSRELDFVWQNMV